MNSTSRNRILSRLKSAPEVPLDSALSENRMTARNLAREEKIEHLKRLMEGMRTEVHVVDDGPWIEVFAEIVRKKGLGNLLYSPGTDVGASVANFWKNHGDGDDKLPELISYEGDVEDFKQQLFKVEASITTSKGAIADSGAIVMWPDEKEPRLMSLVPPVHVVVLDANLIYQNLSEAMEHENWQEGMPANVLLISGPSKTADIELILAFGVHGPKELVVIILDQQK